MKIYLPQMIFEQNPMVSIRSDATDFGIFRERFCIQDETCSETFHIRDKTFGKTLSVKHFVKTRLVVNICVEDLLNSLDFFFAHITSNSNLLFQGMLKCRSMTDCSVQWFVKNIYFASVRVCTSLFRTSSFDV